MRDKQTHEFNSKKNYSSRPIEDSASSAFKGSEGVSSHLISRRLKETPEKSLVGDKMFNASATAAGNNPVDIQLVASRRHSSRIIGLLAVIILLLLGVIGLLFAYNAYRTSYNKIQQSKLANSIDPTSVDLVGASGTGLEGISILQVNGDATITGSVTANTFNGSGADLSNLNADNITSGTLNDARLSPNVALLDANQTFTGDNTFNNTSVFTGSVTLPGGLVINSLVYSFPASQTNGVLTNDGSGNLIWQPIGPCATCINNGGDSFGAAISIGSNDNNDLIFKTNNTTRLTFDTAGDATFTGAIYGDGTQLTGVAKLALNNQTFTGNNQVFQNTANSTTAFEVKNSGAVSVLTVDTQNGKVIAPSLQANTITPTSAMTIGSTSQTFTLNGGGSSTIYINGSGFSTTVGFNGPPTANVVYNFDRTAAAGTYAICTTAGNCGGGGGITGGGTAGTITKFTGPSGVGDSLLTESGSEITVNGTFKVLSASPDYLSLNSYGVAVYDDSAGTTTNYLFPAAGNNTYDVCTSSGNCFGAGGSGANTALSNLDAATMAINTSLLPGLVGPINLGSNTKPFGEVFIYGTSATPASQNFKLTGSATAQRTITFPDESGTVCTTGSTCSGYANNTLSNLGTVALNSVLQPASAGALSLGVSTLPFSDLYLSGSSATPATNRFRITGASAGGLRTITLPDESGTVCTTGSVCSGYAPSTGGSGYVQLQSTTPGTQQSGSLNVSGTGIFGSTVSIGTASAANGSIVIKNSTTAFDLTLNAPNTTTSNKTITFPNETGTVCTNASVCSGYAPATGSGTYFAQGGNSFAGTAYLGTTDANALVFRTGVGTNAAQTRFTVDAAASTLTGNGATSVIGGSTLTLNAAAASDLNLGTTATTGSIIIGGTAQSGAITIGGTGAATGNINIATGTGAQAVNIGTGGTGVKTIAIGGTAANVITIGNTQTAGSIAMGTAMTTGTISIGGASQTGAITVTSGATITTGLAISTNSLTSGTGLSVTSSSTTATYSGDLVKFENTGNSTNVTGNVLKVGLTGASAAGTAVNITNAGTGLSFRVNDDGTYTDSTPFVIDADGSVGIGTTATSAAYRLTVAASGDVTSGEKYIARYMLSTADDSGLIIGYMANGSAVTSSYLSATNSLPLSLGTTGNRQVLSVFSNGGVTIGTTTTPTSRLEVVGTTAMDLPTYGTALTNTLSGTNWSCVSGTCTHTTGSTVALTNSAAIANATKYQVAFTIARTAGSVTVSMGGQTYASNGTTAISAAGSYTWGPTTTSTASFTVTPTSDFAGSISSISIRAITAASTPIAALKTSAGTSVLEFGTNTSNTNSLIGVSAGQYLTTGVNNTAFGSGAFDVATTANRSTAIGYSALGSLTTGDNNTAIGFSAGNLITTGYANTFVGANASDFTTTGYENTAIGGGVLGDNTTGYQNTAIGVQAIGNNLTGNGLIAIGYYAGRGTNSATSGSNSIFIGNGITGGDTSPTNEIVIGGGKAGSTGYGDGTTTIGWKSTTTSSVLYGTNIYFGEGTDDDSPVDAVLNGTSIAAGITNGSGGDISLKSGAGTGTGAVSNIIFSTPTVAASGTTAQTVAERMRIQGANVGIGTAAPATTLHVNGTIRYTNRPAAGTITAIGYDANGDLKNSSSSLRYKYDVQDYSSGLDTVLQLRPVSFKFNGETRQNAGFIAEEIDALGLSEFMLYDDQNRPDGVLYSNMTSLLAKGIQELNTKVENTKSDLTAMQNSLSTSVLTAIANAEAITINGNLTINGITIFNGEVQFNSDTAGTVTIPAGQTSVTVTFTKPMSKLPRVTATPQEVINGSIGVTAKTVNGFTIQLQSAQAGDTDVDWQAIISN